MCGIVGYVGPRQATPMLLEGLKRLEYRGYDSAGIAIMNGKGLETRKAPGKISELESLVSSSPIDGTLGIAHTRWATHGAPNFINSHPQMSCDEKIGVVHNGIIENGSALRQALEDLGHTFRSDTDTEVLAHLIEEVYDGNLEQAVIAALTKVEGTYGIAVVCSDDRDKIVAARKGSPLLIGLGEGEYFVASDVSAILAHTRQVIYMDDGDLAVLDRNGYQIIDMNSLPLERAVASIDWDLDMIERGGFAHFMLKEIFEQPDTVKNTMRGRLLNETGTAKLGGLNLKPEELLKFDNILITACGTSWHSALIGEFLIEELARVPVEVEYASELRYRNPIISDKTLCIVISQSGETADTLAAMREAKRKGALALGIVNVVGSTIARESDGGVYIHAGPEIGVASTKAFTSQVTVFALLSIMLGRMKSLSVVDGKELIRAMQKLPDQIAEILETAPAIEEIAEQFKDVTNFLYLGRGYNFPAALEGALKLKEISYIHAECYPAAEMKHGPIALIDEHMPVVFICTRDSAYEKVSSNMMEVRARKGRIIAIATEGDTEVVEKADHVIYV